MVQAHIKLGEVTKDETRIQVKWILENAIKAASEKSRKTIFLREVFVSTEVYRILYPEKILKEEDIYVKLG